MLASASGMMLRLGVALLLLSLLIRPAIASEQSRFADTMAIGLSVVVIALGVIGGRVARRREPPPIERPDQPIQPRADWVQLRRPRPPTDPD